MPLRLPDYPWDSLEPFAERARAHPGGIVDLSVGSPVDPTPAIIRESLAAATDAHAYPLTAGTPALREAIVEWFARRRGVDDLTVANVLPTIGSKEFIAGLPLWLGLGAGDVVVQPTLAYPTYAVGAALAGATVFSSDDPAEWPESTRLIWVNSPGNPDGRVLGVDELAAAVARARELGAVIASDECYAELGWDDEFADRATPSILDPAVIHGDRSSVLCVYSLSKQSNLAGYRAGFVAGCSRILGELLAVRKHLGTLPPAPIQAAMITALGDDRHVQEQKDRYRVRRARLSAALEAAGYRIDESRGGLYLWATRGGDAWQTVADLADLGILVVPGTFYGEADAQHVRVALTATDEAIGTAVERLGARSK
ncbi:succinyldiaminopimelate transaminase [Lacisediminihabitans profunda]|uniref:Aminotransferase n=1 Tax=Lacisediminihabitans profunda TaxID=2594790 RepID=A0A5C8URJ9_9MICO|nr:succinyldiaminopimelate transaminase [Lacisediminihabitans profunda]TXN31204.1 succinyldiaminopimelate transaminase [Lacisediminihabitans profunda]